MMVLEKEVKRNPALLAMLGGQTEDDSDTKEEKGAKVKKTKKDPKKVNPKGYERNRGKGGTKPMSYYLPQDIITLLNIKAAQENKTKSELVLEGLRYILKDELKNAKKDGRE